MASAGISQRLLAETPISVVDTETTGLYAGGDRIIEIAVVRADPGTAPQVVVDTLINPGRAVGATEIHGITDEDIADAPRFEDVAGHVVEALRGSVFASYNVYFDARFMREELRRAGVPTFPPHLCLMYLRPMLGLGRKCSLHDACGHHRVSFANAHHAGADALAAAALWAHYLEACSRNGIRTFGELSRLKAYKFVDSFDEALFTDDAPPGPPPRQVTFKSRGAVRPPAADARTESARQPVLAAYWDALMAAVTDLEVTPYEVFYLKAKQAALGIAPKEMRWLHARAFSGVLADMCQDKAITVDEAATLSGVTSALREIGWAPGDELRNND